MPGPSPRPSGTEPGASLRVPPAVGGTQPTAHYVPHAELCSTEPGVVHTWTPPGLSACPQRSPRNGPAFAPWPEPEAAAAPGQQVHAGYGRCGWRQHGEGSAYLVQVVERLQGAPPLPTKPASAHGVALEHWGQGRGVRRGTRLAVALGAWPTRLGTLHPPLGLSAPTPRLPRGSLTDQVPVTRAGSLPSRAAGGLGGSKQWEKGKPPPSRKALTTQHRLPPPHTAPLPATAMQPEGPVGRPGQPLPSLGGRQQQGSAAAGAGDSGGRWQRGSHRQAAGLGGSAGDQVKWPLGMPAGASPPPAGVCPASQYIQGSLAASRCGDALYLSTVSLSLPQTATASYLS